ncbi:MAG: beta-lactamase family protein [Armatimonadetes bacterium]|nr:beta-lactamase family protein [Armatimonadota bacterium]
MLITTAMLLASTQADTDLGRQVDAYVRKEMAARHVPGAQVAVVLQGKVVYKRSFGKASLQFDLPVKDTTLFTLNSATKPFTGVAVMQLVQAGKLSLDDPVGKHLDGLPVAWRGVTIGQLATHVSGLPDIVDQSQGGKLVGESEDDAWSKVQTMPLEYPTGTKYSYNQTNYLLLGKVIDKLSGRPFTTFIEEGQFRPAKMAHTRYGDARDVVKGLAQAYYIEQGDDGSVTYRPTGSVFPHFLWTGAGLCSTATDVARWIVALQDGTLLGSKSLEAMWTRGRFVDGKPASWAVGWPASSRADHRWVAGIGGGRSAFFVYPDDGVAVVLLTNLAGSAPEDWIEPIARMVVPGIPGEKG